MQVFNAMQLKKGAKASHNRMGSITQPLQFVPKTEKDEEWAAWNLDWLEWNGLWMHSLQKVVQLLLWIVLRALQEFMLQL